MYAALATPTTLPATLIVIDAARCWRRARDLGQPVQPALYARLARVGDGVLAPVLDGLLTMFEACFRRRFQAGDAADSELTGDERQLIVFLAMDECRDAPPEPNRPELVGALRTALCSTRILLKSTFCREPA